MLIRKTLNKEVLRIAETYLQNGNLWDFLLNINNEIKYYQKEIIENQNREENWADNFVERVISKRQSEFNTAWNEFPKALSNFNGKIDYTGTLMDKKKNTSSSSTGRSIVRTTEKSPIKSNTVTTVKNINSTVLSPQNTKNTSKLQGGRGISSTAITTEEVALAMQSPSEVEQGCAEAEASHLSVPGK